MRGIDSHINRAGQADSNDSQTFRTDTNTALAFSSDVDGQITDLITSYFNSTTMTAEAATAAFAKIIANADK